MSSLVYFKIEPDTPQDKLQMNDEVSDHQSNPNDWLVRLNGQASERAQLGSSQLGNSTVPFGTKHVPCQCLGSIKRPLSESWIATH